MLESISLSDIEDQKGGLVRENVEECFLDNFHYLQFYFSFYECLKDTVRTRLTLEEFLFLYGEWI